MEARFNLKNRGFPSNRATIASAKVSIGLTNQEIAKHHRHECCTCATLWNHYGKEGKGGKDG